MTALAMTGVAVLLWPDAGSRRRARIRRVIHPGRSPRVLRVSWPTGVPVPITAAAGATAASAALTTPLVAVLAGLGAGLVGRAWARRREDVATEQRVTALVGGLAALAADLRTGRSLGEATDAAAAACGDPSTGDDLVRAVRVPDRPEASGPLRGPLARLSGAVLLSGRTGCSLADLVSSVEDDLRARHRLDLELRSATAGPRAGALLLAGLPVLGLAMGSGVGADPWEVLTTTGTGQVLLAAGVGLELAGVTWSSRLVRRAVR